MQNREIGRVSKALATFVACFLLTIAAHSQEAVPAARALLPMDVANRGTLTATGAMVWPPYQWITEEGEITGIEPDLIRLLAGKLGLKVEFSDVKFASVIPGIETGRYNVAIGQLGITKTRLNVADFIPITHSRLGLLVGRGHAALNANDLCGHTLAVTIGSQQVAVVDALSKKCVADGKAPMVVNQYPDTPSSYLAVASGRVEGFLLTRAVGVYMGRNNPKLDVSQSTLDGFDSFSGLMIARGKPELKAALTAALESAMADGSYTKILKKYGVPDIAITTDVLRKPASEVAVD